MIMIATEEIKKLRQETGISVMQCRKALMEAGGNFEKAKEKLLEKGLEIALKKKKERELGAGIVHAYIHSSGKIGALLVLLCETDFVAKNKEFGNLAHNLAMQIAAMNPKDEGELLEQEFIKDAGKKVGQLIDEAIQKFGERIEIGSFSRSAI